MQVTVHAAAFIARSLLYHMHQLHQQVQAAAAVSGTETLLEPSMQIEKHGNANDLSLHGKGTRVNSRIGKERHSICLLRQGAEVREAAYTVQQ